MRHTRVVFLIAVMLVGLLAVGGGGAATAQEATPVAEEDHPLVGAWVLDTHLDDPDNPLTLAVFSADGTYFEVAPADGLAAGSQVGAGVWESTGDSSAYLTFWILSGPDVTVVIRAELEADPGALELTGTYTLEVINPDGTGTGQVGPGTVEGTRIVAEPPGVPVGTFEDLFVEPVATPAG